VSEPVLPAIIDRGLATPSVLAQVIIAKYADHLPLYRQEAIYLRSGIELSRAMLAEWIGACGVALQPLADRLRERLTSMPVLHADETPVGLLDPGAGQLRRSYFFAYRTAIGQCKRFAALIRASLERCQVSAFCRNGDFVAFHPRQRSPAVR
jgi:hypothetical protein